MDSYTLHTVFILINTLRCNSEVWQKRIFWWAKAIAALVHHFPLNRCVCRGGGWGWGEAFLRDGKVWVHIGRPCLCPSHFLIHAISYKLCMLGFWNFLYGFLTENELCPFLELCPFEKIRMKSCGQDISKSIWAWGLKIGQLIGDDE